MHRNSIIPALLILLLLAISCNTVNKSSSLIEEDKLYMSRIYIGNYLDYRHTPSDANGNPDLIWITTTRDSIQGKISAYGKECVFSPGERLYISRVLATTGKREAWLYRIENSDTIRYMMNENQNHNISQVENWLNTLPENTLPPNTGSREK